MTCITLTDISRSDLVQGLVMGLGRAFHHDRPRGREIGPGSIGILDAVQRPGVFSGGSSVYCALDELLFDDSSLYAAGPSDPFRCLDSPPRRARLLDGLDGRDFGQVSRRFACSRGRTTRSSQGRFPGRLGRTSAQLPICRIEHEVYRF